MGIQVNNDILCLFVMSNFIPRMTQSSKTPVRNQQRPPSITVILVHLFSCQRAGNRHTIQDLHITKLTEIGGPEGPDQVAEGHQLFTGARGRPPQGAKPSSILSLNNLVLNIFEFKKYILYVLKQGIFFLSKQCPVNKLIK